MRDSKQLVNETSSEVTSGDETASDAAPTRARGTRRSPSVTLPGVRLTWSEAWSRLDFTERVFVRECMKDGDVDRASHKAGHRRPFDLLGRVTVREALLSAAPFTASHITARLTRPYVLQQLVNQSLSGDVTASKMLLSLDVKPASPMVSYTRSASANSPSTNSPSTASDNTDSEVH